MGSSYFIPSSSSTSIIPIILMITFYLLIPIAFPMEDNEIRYICPPNNTPFTDNYNRSLTLVLNDLISNTSSLDGFRTASYHWPLQGPGESAYGLALCRGDVSSDDCKACVNNASITIIDEQHCPESRVAILWRDYCFLKYSDDNFFGTVDTDNMYSTRGNNMWSRSTSQEEVNNFMVSLSQTASKSSKLYAYGTANIMDDASNPNHYVTVYGMAQCTRDISSDNCTTCLDSARNSLRGNNMTSYQGARFLCGTCDMRYETYNFNS